MSKLTKYLIFVFTALFVVYFLLRLTNVLQIYKAENVSSAPSIVPGDWILATNLKQANRLNYICFSQDNSNFPKGIWIQRLVALEGDRVEIINGVLYVNGANQDSLIKTMHNYWVDAKAIPQMKNNKLISDISLIFNTGDSSRLAIEENKIKPYMNARKMKYSTENNFLFKDFKSNWTQDNFGPVTVPKNCGFILGDNRDTSIDSRFLGFIELQSIMGVKF